MNIINNSNFWYFFPSLFFCLLRPALVSGPFLPDLFLSLFPFIPTSNFYNNWLNVIYYLPVCFIIYNQNKSIDTK